MRQGGRAHLVLAKKNVGGYREGDKSQDKLIAIDWKMGCLSSNKSKKASERGFFTFFIFGP